LINKSKNILVFRFSALGDVAMTIPVFWALEKDYPDVKITFVSRGFAGPLTNSLSNVRFIKLDDKGRHKGLWGIVRLFWDLKKVDDWDALADLHDVLRTKILRFLFLFVGVKGKVINKGRASKRKLTRKSNKKLVQLEHSVDRYADVFKRMGLPAKSVSSFNGIFASKPDLLKYETLIQKVDPVRLVGIAPFAKHKGKMYPLPLMQRVINELSADTTISLILFGGRGEEQQILEKIANESQNVYSLAGLLALDEELEVMANLDVMVSMDSANMHLATLSGARVVSIWGATHPFAGFYGWQQNPENAIQLDLFCRPCSVFGNKPCYRKDFACMNELAPSLITAKVKELLTSD